MQMRGTFYGLLRDVKGNTIISFNIGQNLPDVANIEQKALDIKVTQHREKRTMSQNSYYWVLIGKLAAAQRISVARLHNLLLRDVCLPFIVDGKVAMQPIPNTDKAENEVLEAETFHLKPTSGVIKGADGDIYRWYIVLRGSSTFNTQEMTVLLDRLIDECKESGIETATPWELAQMRAYSEERRRGD